MNNLCSHGIVVTDYLTQKDPDVSAQLQKIIDGNPNRTIFFPDGIYTLEEPVCIPAEPTKSVSLVLSSYAVIKAADNWSSQEALIRLGGKDDANDIFTNGSNYGIEGGIIDGNGKAKGISIDSGRETFIRNVSIKNTPIGIHIKYGTNNGSSDADIFGVNITGTCDKESIGVFIEGFDNTLTNMRIANVVTGIKMTSAGNLLRNIHPLYYLHEKGKKYYADTVAFWDGRGKNWYDNCYSDQFACSFYMTEGVKSVYNSCYCYWYSSFGKKRIAFEADGSFDSVVSNLTIGSSENDSYDVTVLSEKQGGGKGKFHTVLANKDALTDDLYMPYLLD